MMTKKYILLSLSLLLAIAIVAQEKLIVVNEGNWQSDNGKLTYFEDDHVVINSQKDAAAFIKMLNDDFLKSELTKQDYTSIAKDRITN